MNKFVPLLVILIGILIAGGLRYHLEKTNGSYQFQPERINYAYVDNTNGHIIYNGKVLGPGSNPLIEGEDIVYTNPDSKLIFNGQDMGTYLTIYNRAGVDVVINSGHIAFFRLIHNEPHMLYDGRDMGIGDPLSHILLAGDHIVFSRTFGKTEHLIYDGNDIGEGYSAVLTKNHFVFMRSWQCPSEIIYDGKGVGLGCDPMIAGDSLGFISLIKDTDHIIFNGKDIGLGDGPCDMNEKHIACAWGNGLEYHIIYDGKDLGIGNDPKLDGDNILYSSTRSDLLHNSTLTYNGRNIGQGLIPVLNSGDYAFLKQIGTSDISITRVIFNGKDLGLGNGVQLLNHNIAIIVPPSDTQNGFTTYFDGRIIDGQFFVMTAKK